MVSEHVPLFYIDDPLTLFIPMKARYTLPLLLLLLPVAMFAQQVQKCCGASNSTFLLGNLTYAKHTQSLYLPGDLSNAQDGTINTLYFRYGSTGEDLGVTLSNVMIRMALVAQTTFTGGNAFFTDLDTVLMVPELTIAPGIEGDWFSFPIGVPFQYNANRTLVLDIWYTDSTTPNFGTLGTTNNGRKLYANDLSLPTGSTSSGTWQDFGFDVGAPTAIAEPPLDVLSMVPMPGYTEWMMTWTAGSVSGGTMQLSDASGRLLRAEKVRADGSSFLLDMTAFATGVYVVQLRTSEGVVRSQRFLKP